jgi:hypothetical protein
MVEGVSSPKLTGAARAEPQAKTTEARAKAGKPSLTTRIAMRVNEASMVAVSGLVQFLPPT